MAELLESIMVISFGFSWPTNIIKSLKARTAKGTSLLFLVFVDFGYVCGIAAKLVSGKITFALVFYVLNFFMVAAAIILYFRNRRLDRRNAESNTAPAA
jgi:bacteriorhodopsin